MVRIKKFGVMQTAKVVAVIYFIISLVVIVPFMMLGSMMSDTMFPGMENMGAPMLILIPIVYSIIGFIFTAIGCVIYNLIAGVVGGIEIEMETAD